MIFIGPTVLDTCVAKIHRFYKFTIRNDCSRGCKFDIGEISYSSSAWNSTHSIPALEFHVSTLWEFIKNRILSAPFHFRFVFSLGKKWEIDKKTRVSNFLVFFFLGALWEQLENDICRIMVSWVWQRDISPAKS